MANDNEVESGELDYGSLVTAQPNWFLANDKEVETLMNWMLFPW